MITIDKKNTLMQLALEKKINSNKYKYKYSTRHKWRCLGCGKDIYVKYDNLTVRSIYCKDDECQSYANHENILQYQYLRKLKEEQFKIIETIL